MRRLFLLVALIFLSVARAALAMPEIMPLEKIQSGMDAVAYTVIDPTGKIEPFDVKIIGLLDNGKGSAKMIMARASGDVIEKTGGVLQGMSGSPVYIDGKLVGAVAAGLKEMSPYTFFITPIESMLKLWDMPDTQNQLPYNKNTALYKKITGGGIEPETKAAIFFSGFDSNGLEFLKREMKPLGFDNFYAASANGRNSVRANATLEPGAPMGVAVVCGDFLVGATGTVTAVDGKKILGFGHPFTHAGNVNFFMTDSKVIGTVSGVNGNGVKISSVGSIIGRINQDREAGVAGVLGNFPATVPITVTIKDAATNKTETYSAKIAYNETLVPKLGSAIAYTALSKTADSLAESTVAVNFEIKTNAVDSGTISRQNVFYSPSDVGQSAVTELLKMLTLICSNTVEESSVFGIDVTMTLDNSRKTASLVSAVPDKKLVKPGETVNLTVTLQPYRQPEETIVIPYTVPLTRKEGPLVLDLHGGALVPVAQATGVVTPSTGTPEQIFQAKIKSLLGANRNNQLIVETNAAPAPKTPQELKAEVRRIKKVQERAKKLGLKPAPANNKFDTGYIIDNVIQATINVDKF